MTSEILILTPSAVALAADSAVTVGNRKTYNGVNKLFMLSNNPPMGIMTYNLSNFSNVPLETIIKEFRTNIKNKQINTVEEFRDEFKKFLEEIVKNPLYSYSFENQLSDFITQITFESTTMEYSIFEDIIKNVASNVNYNELEEFSEEVLKKLKSNEEELNKIIPKEITNKKSFLENLKKFFVYNMYLEPYTGIVIAGFNKDRLFPSYVEFNITYLFDDKFLLKEIKKLDILGGQVHVRPLAQDDVINTFLGSIDKNTQLKLNEYVDNIYKNYSQNLKDAIIENPKLNDDEKNRLLQEISKIDSFNNELTDSFEQYINRLKEEHSKPILESISSLPKEELSNLAESLINITSLKRKVQSDLETVGGPVDVAIITRGDGFIWTKRKHYFDANLNRHFFERK